MYLGLLALLGGAGYGTMRLTNNWQASGASSSSGQQQKEPDAVHVWHSAHHEDNSAHPENWRDADGVIGHGDEADGEQQQQQHGVHAHEFQDHGLQAHGDGQHHLDLLHAQHALRDEQAAEQRTQLLEQAAQQQEHAAQGQQQQAGQWVEPQHHTNPVHEAAPEAPSLYESGLTAVDIHGGVVAMESLKGKVGVWDPSPCRHDAIAAPPTLGSGSKTWRL